MLKTVKLTNKSLDKIGLPKDYKEAIVQYIDNGFEAGASVVNIDFAADEIGHINSFEISDNGHGISYEDLGKTFGTLLDSQKVGNRQSSYMSGGKGRGRLSFYSFAGRSIWKTRYIHEGKSYEYNIIVNSDQRDKYDVTQPKEVQESLTGTTVEFAELHDISGASLEADDFIELLKLELGWYLHLNKDRGFGILINGEPIDYATIIGDDERLDMKISAGKAQYSFKIWYIRWEKKIGEDAFFHFQNAKGIENFRTHTSFNKVGGGAYGFFHSVYVQSDYFDDFNGNAQKIAETGQGEVLGKNQSDVVYTKLLSKLRKILKEKRDDFYRISAEHRFMEFERENVLPKFGTDRFGLFKKEEFKNVFKEIYLIEPTLFLNIKDNQIKSLLAMLSLLLDSNERENILTIIDSVVNELDQDGRQKLAMLLKKTTLSNIVRTIEMITDRESVIELLKTLVFDQKRFTNERDHIQEAIQVNTWIFGEEFTNVTNDKNFESALSEYLWLMDGLKGSPAIKKKYKIDSREKLRRMDIFLCRQRLVNDMTYGDTSQLQENVVIELKNPRITLGKDELRQVEDYRDIILKEKRFTSEMRIWKLFLVANDIDSYIRSEQEMMKDKGKKFLVRQSNNFEIFVLTWSDIFDIYRIRHNYILEKLQFDRDVLIQEMNLDNSLLSATPQVITEVAILKAKQIA